MLGSSPVTIELVRKQLEFIKEMGDSIETFPFTGNTEVDTVLTERAKNDESIFFTQSDSADFYADIFAWMKDEVNEVKTVEIVVPDKYVGLVEQMIQQKNKQPDATVDIVVPEKFIRKVEDFVERLSHQSDTVSSTSSTGEKQQVSEDAEVLYEEDIEEDIEENIEEDSREKIEQQTEDHICVEQQQEQLERNVEETTARAAGTVLGFVPNTNGLAEQQVKMAKTVMKKTCKSQKLDQIIGRIQGTYFPFTPNDTANKLLSFMAQHHSKQLLKLYSCPRDQLLKHLYKPQEGRLKINGLFVHFLNSPRHRLVSGEVDLEGLGHWELVFYTLTTRGWKKLLAQK